MSTSRDLLADRPAVGQLLIRLLRQFRYELIAPAAESGYGDLREAHLQVFGNLGGEGVRLTELARRAQLALSTISELVDDLQHLGYLERHADPEDGRARLVVPTARGRQALADAGDRVAGIEQHWSGVVGADRFEQACRILLELLDRLEAEPRSE